MKKDMTRGMIQKAEKTDENGRKKTSYMAGGI